MVPGGCLCRQRGMGERGMEIDNVCCGPLGSSLPHPGGTGKSEGERERKTHGETHTEKERIRTPLALSM